MERYTFCICARRKNIVSVWISTLRLDCRLGPMLKLLRSRFAYESLNRQNRRRGFTLIELSIVLVIIGLIIGGVLMGRDLIAAAVVRSEISQIEQYKTAATTFKVKYDCIPGDCSNVQEIGLGTNGGPGANGDGNEKIFAWPWVNAAPVDARAREYFNFWYHLQQANMIEGQYKGYTNEQNIGSGDGYFPVMKAGNGWVFAMSTEFLHPAFPDDDIDFGNILYLAGLVNPSPDPAYNGFSPVTPVMTAYNIDQKIDDGLPFSGSVRVGSGYSGPMLCNPGSWCDPALMSMFESGFCSTGLEYNITNQNAKCIVAANHAF